jgi:IS605 OrfB family transposase
MKRTVSIKLLPSATQQTQLLALQVEFAAACNLVASSAAPVKCSNRVALHHICYYAIREAFPSLGSQLSCCAVASVAQSYKSLIANNPELKKQDWPVIDFRPGGSVHFDKRTYSLKGELLSLFTLEGRALIPMKLGGFQKDYLAAGVAKEAELVSRKGMFYFNLVLDMPDAEPSGDAGNIIGVDVGENNLAATSTGKIFGGGNLRHKRDKHLAHRRRLQSNGSRSAKQRLRKISGKETRHVKAVNHEVSKAIVNEAVNSGAGEIRMEDLTNIRDNIKAGKRVRTRLHRWSFRELQSFIAYKGEAAGIRVTYVNPAYTSKTCSVCGSIGTRNRHKFSCIKCGNLAHSDCNASRNIARFAEPIGTARGVVNHPTNVHLGSPI